MTDSENVFPNTNNIDLFAGLPVKDYKAALEWYEKLLGCPPTYVVSDSEAVWQLAEHRSLFIEKSDQRAGGAMHTIFIEKLDIFTDAAASKGVEPFRSENYSNGVRKVLYHDPDGNEIGFGGAPLPE